MATPTPPSITRRLYLAALRWRINNRLRVPSPQDVERQVWHKQPLSIALLFVFTVSLAVANTRIPSPGEAVAALAVAAAVMTVLGELKGGEKLAWVLVLFGFLGVERTSIRTERSAQKVEQERAHAEQLKHFGEIGQGIESAIQQNSMQFTETMSRSDKIFSRVEDSMKAQTGGDSFAYITFTPEPAYLTFDGFTGSGKPWFLVAISSHGKYPLRNIHATLMDDERRLAAMKEYNKHPDGAFIKAIDSADTLYERPYLRPQSPEGPSGDVETLGSYPIPQASSMRLSIAFSSLNGFWNESLHLGFVNGEWHQCLSVVGPTAKQMATPFIYCDSVWPEGKALAIKDWAGITRPSPKP